MNMKSKNISDPDKRSANLADYVTVKKLSEELNGSFSESSLWYLFFNREKNGLSKCVIKVGRKLLISRMKFCKWLEQQQEVSNG